MKKRNRKLTFELSFRNYLKLVKAALVQPLFYSSQIPTTAKLTELLSFYITNIVLAFLILTLSELLVIKDIAVFFFIISELLLFVPMMIVFLFIYAFLLFLIAKIFRAKGSYRAVLTGLAYASLPLVFVTLPLISILALIWTHLILNVYFENRLGLSRLWSFLICAFPLLTVLILGIIFNFLDLTLLNQLISLLRNL